MAHKMNEFKNRYVGRMPKIGIRPVIDGRRQGVRESLEVQTMNMAKAAAQLISENLRYYNGLPVECVIADTTIGGAAEAAAAEDKFSRENVTATLSVTPCWCYGTETLDINPLTTKAIWGFNGTERPGAVYLAAAQAGHTQRGLPAFSIYGTEVQDADDTTIPEDVKVKILRFAKAAMAVGQMKGKSYASLGGSCMGIAGSFAMPNLYQNYLGMRWESLDQTEITRRIDREVYDKEEFELAMKWVKEYCQEGVDKNLTNYKDSPYITPHTEEQKADEWERVVKAMLITRDILVGNPRLAELGFGEEAAGRNAIVGGIQGQRQWTDHFPNHDFTEAMLASSFDWNGIRPPFMIATENDNLNGLSMLFGHLLSYRASIFADVRTYWSADAIERATSWKPEAGAANGLIHLINSGAATLDGTGEMRDEDGKQVMKPFWDINSEDVDRCLSATKWCPANLGYFRGAGYSSSDTTRANMPVTMIRINYVEGVGPTIQIAEGETVHLPEEVSVTLMERTDPTWPCTWFAPRLTGKGAFTSVYDVMANWGANHGAITYGHIGADIITMASMLRIPVAMHNVASEDVYRPVAWNGFGTEDAESIDYRACKALGPLYGRSTAM